MFRIAFLVVVGLCYCCAAPFDEMLTRINEFRTKNGKGPLSVDPRLNRSAQKYAEEIVDIVHKNKHELLPYNLGLNQHTIQDRIKSEGLYPPEALFFGENVLGEATNDTARFMETLEKSPLTREKVLSDYNRIGFGHVKIPCSRILSLRGFHPFSLLCTVNSLSAVAHILVQDFAYIPEKQPPAPAPCPSGQVVPKVFILRPPSCCPQTKTIPPPAPPKPEPKLVPVVTIITDTANETGVTRIYREPTKEPIMLPDGQNRLVIEFQPNNLL